MKKIATAVLALLTCLPILVSSQNVRMVKDLNPGTADGLPYNDPSTGLLASLDTVLIFMALGESNSLILCRSDGGKPVNTVPLLPPLTGNERLESYAVAGGKFWFLVDRDATADLYSSDGTIAGTKLRYQKPAARFSKIRAFGDGIVFHEFVEPFDHFLTRFDPAGNAAVRIGQFNFFAGIMDLAVKNTTIFGIGCADKDKSDRYLFRSDGQAGSLDTIARLNTGNESNTGTFLTPVGDKLFFFFQKNGEIKKLWVSDQTAVGTVGLKSMTTDAVPTLFPQGTVTEFNGKFVFRGRSANSNTGTELWASDGTANGTDVVKDLVAGSGSGSPHSFTHFDGKLFFTASNTLGNFKVWETNLTAAGTKPVFPDFANTESNGSGLTVYRDSLAFEGYRHDIGSELMFCKGTASSLKVVSDASTVGDALFFPSNLVAAGHLLYFAAGTAAFGRELWVYNSFLKPTIPVQEIENQRVLYVSPNPGGTYFQLGLPAGATGFLRVFSADGRLVLEKETAGTAVLETGNWPAGSYHVLFFNKNVVARGFWVKI